MAAVKTAPGTTGCCGCLTAGRPWEGRWWQTRGSPSPSVRHLAPAIAGERGREGEGGGKVGGRVGGGLLAKCLNSKYIISGEVCRLGQWED